MFYPSAFAIALLRLLGILCHHLPVQQQCLCMWAKYAGIWNFQSFLCVHMSIFVCRMYVCILHMLRTFVFRAFEDRPQKSVWNKTFAMLLSNKLIEWEREREWKGEKKRGLINTSLLEYGSAISFLFRNKSNLGLGNLPFMQSSFHFWRITNSNMGSGCVEYWCRCSKIIKMHF